MAFRFEYVASVVRTAPLEFLSCTCRTSFGAVVEVSWVSMCSQNESIALAILEGMVTL